MLRCLRSPILLGALGLFPLPTVHAAETLALNTRELQALRESGDLTMQRKYVWSIVARLTAVQPGESQPDFESWYGEGQVFGGDSGSARPQGIRGFSRATESPVPHSDGVPVLAYTLYNAAAYEHIRSHRLNLRTALERLRAGGVPDVMATGQRSVPEFPSDAIVLKTVWWPVAQSGITALPVWDPEHNPPRRQGNGYTSWQRVVAVEPQQSANPGGTLRVEFAGRSFRDVRRISIGRFHRVVVDAQLAARLMRDEEARRVAVIALGRNLVAGDSLVLVGANLASREIDGWIWAAMWWSDRSDLGSFAADRPANLRGVWRDFKMQTAFDAEKPASRDGSPHVCFNPWLEGRFPDQGNGGGTVSNCLACHVRASFPAVNFLPVRRGSPDLAADPAFSPDRLRTSSLWSVPLHAAP